MSNSAKYNFVKERVNSAFSNKSFTVAGAKLTGSDVNTTCYILQAWGIITLDLYQLDYQAHCDKLLSWIHAVNSADDLSFVFNASKACYDYLITIISNNSDPEKDKIICSYKNFKGICRQHNVLPELLCFCKDDINLITDLSSSYVNESYNLKKTFKAALSRVTQFLLFCSKIVLERPDLQQSALQDYKDLEQSLAALISSYDDSLLKDLRRIISKWFKGFKVDYQLVRHGNGATADAVKPCALTKNFEMKTDHMVDILTRTSDHSQSNWLPQFCTQPLKQGLDRASRLCFVPKNFTKLRSISMEPTTLQFLQQAGMQSLYDYFKRQKFLKRIIKLQDQSQNRFLAYYGSYSDELATIDLSHASDSVTWKLVKELFRGVPGLYSWLIATRSKATILPNGEYLLLNKFAPMGSAFCFPIETIVFAACIEYVRQKRECDCAPLSTYELHNRSHQLPPYSVYGDDIIIPKEWCDDVVNILTTLGFCINAEKSYTSGLFKESCGINCFDGHDITPIKFKPTFGNKELITPECFCTLTVYANLAYAYGYKRLRSFIIQLCIENGRRPLFSDNILNTSTIYSPNPSNFHLLKGKKRFNKYTSVRAIVDKSAVEAIKQHYYNRDNVAKGSNESLDTTINYDADVELVSYMSWSREGDKTRFDPNNILPYSLDIYDSNIIYYNIIPIWLKGEGERSLESNTIIYGGIYSFNRQYVLSDNTMIDYRSTSQPQKLVFHGKTIEIGHNNI